MFLFHLLQKSCQFSLRGRVGEIGNIEVLVSPILPLIRFLESIKSTMFLKLLDKYKNITTQECIHAVIFQFYGIASLEFDLFKMGAKLHTITLST
jgi:hypothetical protein